MLKIDDRLHARSASLQHASDSFETWCLSVLYNSCVVLCFDRHCIHYERLEFVCSEVLSGSKIDFVRCWSASTKFIV
jgi:hypothetical protein